MEEALKFLRERHNNPRIAVQSVYTSIPEATVNYKIDTEMTVRWRGAAECAALFRPYAVLPADPPSAASICRVTSSIAAMPSTGRSRPCAAQYGRIGAVCR